MALEHASLTNLDSGDKAEVLFNPNEYTIGKSNNFAQAVVPGLGSPLLQFVNGNLQTLDMQLFLDTYEAHSRGGAPLNAAGDDVRPLAAKVIDLMRINPETHAPPVVLFAWGSLTFTGVLAKVTQHYTRFAESGLPVRVRLEVTFQEWKTPLQELQEVKRQTSSYTRVYQVAENDNLSMIAARLYKDPTKWRPIALANQLEDPRRLAIGQTLQVPPLPYRNPDTGEVLT